MSGCRAQVRRMAWTLALLLVALTGGVWAAQPGEAQTVREAQWYLDVWQMEQVWKTSQGAGITVALMATGVDASHPDLAGHILPSHNESGDSAGHGTGMAGLIVGQGR